MHGHKDIHTNGKNKTSIYKKKYTNIMELSFKLIKFYIRWIWPEVQPIRQTCEDWYIVFGYSLKAPIMIVSSWF